MPAFHWRQILSAHNTTQPGGMSINMELDKLFHWGSNHRLVLSLPNSYATDDGVAVQTWTDDGGSQSQAKAQVCKAALVELLLRAPHRGAVRLLAGAQLTRNRWNVERIWDEVCRLQLHMHGLARLRGCRAGHGRRRHQRSTSPTENAACPPPPHAAIARRSTAADTTGRCRRQRSTSPAARSSSSSSAGRGSGSGAHSSRGVASTVAGGDADMSCGVIIC